MLFELPSELQVFARSVQDLARSELAPRALTRAHEPAFPRDASQLFADRGLTGIVGRPSAAGRPSGVLAGVVAVEAVASVCPRGADAMHQGSFAAALLLSRYGTTTLHRNELDAILIGRRLLSIAVSEEGAGSQAAALSTTATFDGSRVVIEGSKRFTVNSGEADAFIVYAAFGPSIADIGAVIVEHNAEGLLRGDPVSFMSGETWRPLAFYNLALSPEAVLFSAGGFGDKASFFDIEKIGNAARALGLGWCAFDIARQHATERRQFDRPLAEFQGLQWKLAEVRTALEAAQLTLYRAAERADRSALRGEDASCAKLSCNRATMAAADLAVQILGGAGYSQSELAEYCFRKARGHLINGGVVELMLTRIAEGIFGRKFPQTAN